MKTYSHKITWFLTGLVSTYTSPGPNYSVPVVYISGNNISSIVLNDYITVSYSETGATGQTGSVGPLGPTGLAGGEGSGIYNFYFDLESGADSNANGPGPGFISATPTIDSVSTTCAYIYPNNVYFNENAGTPSSWSSGYPVGTNNTWNTDVSTNIFFKIPRDGEIISISVNQLTWFTYDGTVDVIMANGTTYRSIGVLLPGLTTLTPPAFPISGYSTTFSNSSLVYAGEGLTCVIKRQISWSYPFSPTPGIINITVYVKF